jgi:integrase
MRKINRPEAEHDNSEMLRRLTAARARVPHLPTHFASTKPLSEAGIRRRHAVLSAALNDAVDRHLIGFSPAATVKFRMRKAKPLLWTQARVDRWRQDGKRPATVMVWSPEQAGEFLDSIEAQRLYFLFHLACYWGLRRGELCRLEWSDLDLGTRRLHVRGDVKSEDSNRIIIIDEGTAQAGKVWQERQLFERLEWSDGWQDSGRVLTQADGRPLRPAHVSEHFKVLTRQAGLPPVRFHDLRHGSASMQLAAGTDLKVVSETMGHSTSSFTADVYVTVLEEMGEAAAAAIAAFVPRKARPEATK